VAQRSDRAYGAKCSVQSKSLRQPGANALKYEIQIVGSVDDGFTSAEISEEGSDSLVRVFELERGWYVECNQLERLRQPELLDAVLRAPDELLHFVNRKGGEPAPDTSRAEFSLWLMQRDDGKGFSAPST
jgi:hypothetical protein